MEASQTTNQVTTYDGSELKMSFEFVRSLISDRGITVPTKPRPVTVERIGAMTAEEKVRASSALQMMKFLYSSLEIVPDRDSGEKALMDRALSFFGFRLKKEGRDLIGENDIIEIYDVTGVQLYRSLNFFQTSGYSLEDLLLNEWHKLWERPQAVMQSMFAEMGQLINGEKALIAVKTPDHIVKEILPDYNGGNTHRLLDISFKYAMALYAKDSDEITGFVVTSACKPVGDDETSKQLHFI